jgi:HEAT repeat protein
MQFRKVGKRIRVLAYRGYDKDKRQSVIKMLGSFDAYTHETPVELLDNLNDEEKAELKDYINGLKQQSSERYEQILISHLGRDVVKVAGLILDENSRQSEQWGNEMWAALETMQKSLKKAGFKRPVKQPKLKPVNQEQAGLEF